MADDKENEGKDGGEPAQGNSKPKPTDTMKVGRKPNDASSSKGETQEEFQQWAKEAGFLPTFPHDFIGKWPLTRAERIQELDFLSQHYNQTGQKENIDAAKAWHGQFPPDETVPDEIVIFQDGKIVKESELQLEGGAIWEEEPPSDDFMTGHGQGTSHNLAPPGPPAVVTGNANWTYFKRASNSHMYEV